MPEPQLGSAPPMPSSCSRTSPEVNLRPLAEVGGSPVAPRRAEERDPAGFRTLLRNPVRADAARRAAARRAASSELTTEARMVAVPRTRGGQREARTRTRSAMALRATSLVGASTSNMCGTPDRRWNSASTPALPRRRA